MVSQSLDIIASGSLFGSLTNQAGLTFLENSRKWWYILSLIGTHETIATHLLTGKENKYNEVETESPVAKGFLFLFAMGTFYLKQHCNI